MRALALAALVTLALAASGCSSTSTSGSTTSGATTSSGAMMNHTMMMDYKVSITDNQFNNGTLTVPVGAKVTWTNNGQNPHSVTADDGSFDSSPNCQVGVPLSQVCMTNGATFSFTFQKTGTVKYHCKVHSSMTATITVVAMSM